MQCEQRNIKKHLKKSHQINKINDVASFKKLVKGNGWSKTLIENLPQKVFLKDNNLIYVSCNSSYARDLNIQPNEISGKTDFDFFSEDLARKYRQDDKRVLELGNSIELEEKYHHAGKEYWVKTVKTPIRDDCGNVTGILGIFWDITKRKQAEKKIQKLNKELEKRVNIRTKDLLTILEELKEREKILRQKSLMVETITDGIIITDLNGTIVDWNKGAEIMFGFKKNETLGKTPAIIYKSEDVPMLIQKIIKSLSENGKWTGEINYMHKDGSSGYCETIVVPLLDDDKNIIATIGFNHDITIRKKVEKRQNLLIRIMQLLNESGETHDYIKVILSEIKEFSQFDAVGIRLRNGEDFPFIETSGFSGQFVKSETYLCRHDHNGEIIRDEEGEPVLDCMCGNIIRNNIDSGPPFFSQSGSFWTNSTTELLASTTEQDRQSRTRNRCNGEGYESVALIPLSSGNETIGLLQLNDRRKNMFTIDLIEFYEGLGASIGIALARKQTEEARKEKEALESVKNLAGAIAHEFSQPLQALKNYYSLIKSGSTNGEHMEKSGEMIDRIKELTNDLRNITLLNKMEYVDTKILDIKSSSKNQILKSGDRILVVDDEENVLQTMVELLHYKGYQCDGAKNGIKALDLVQQKEYKVIISDVMMPEMSGPELLKRLKKSGNKSYFIFLTGYEMTDELEKVSQDADLLITKPVNFNQLITKLEEVSNSK